MQNRIAVKDVFGGVVDELTENEEADERSRRIGSRS
jgi:hypothetical protein